VSDYKTLIAEARAVVRDDKRSYNFVPEPRLLLDLADALEAVAADRAVVEAEALEAAAGDMERSADWTECNFIPGPNGKAHVDAMRGGADWLRARASEIREGQA
jgi:hypothetical protein